MKKVKELSHFASGLERDLPAVENAVVNPLSHGFVEGTEYSGRFVVIYNKTNNVW